MVCRSRSSFTVVTCFIESLPMCSAWSIVFPNLSLVCPESFCLFEFLLLSELVLPVFESALQICPHRVRLCAKPSNSTLILSTSLPLMWPTSRREEVFSFAKSEGWASLLPGQGNQNHQVRFSSQSESGAHRHGLASLLLRS